VVGGRRSRDAEASVTHGALELLEAFGLPRRPDRPFEAVAPFVARDKKFRGGRYRLVLPREGERCRLEEVPSEELREAYEALRRG
jgi:3-dehydroquinate synthetase